MWSNKYDKWQMEIGDMMNPRTQLLEKSVNRITKPENKGKTIFYPYRTSQTHAGIERDANIVLDLLKQYQKAIIPENYESDTALNEPTKQDLYQFRQDCFYIDRYLQELDKLEERIEFFEEVKDIAETDLTHREKQRMIHFVAHSRGIPIGSNPREKAELPNGETVIRDYFYQTDVLGFRALDYLENIQNYFQEKSEEKETLEELPTP